MENFIVFSELFFGTYENPSYRHVEQDKTTTATISKDISSRLSTSYQSKPSSQQLAREKKYESDVKALQSKWGRFESGLCIEETLQNMLVLCPRTRQRTDAYYGLMSHLDSEYGVKLNIKSRKRR